MGQVTKRHLGVAQTIIVVLSLLILLVLFFQNCGKEINQIQRGFDRVASNMPSYEEVTSRVSRNANLMIDFLTVTEETSFIESESVIDDHVAKPMYKDVDKDLLSSFANPWDKQKLKEKLGSDYNVVLDYVESVMEMAVLEYVEDNSTASIPPGITIAQAILESGSGRSKLSEKYNNHFGIKARMADAGKNLLSQKKTHLLKDSHFFGFWPAIGVVKYGDEHNWNRFQTYARIEDSFQAHNDLLHGERYAWIWGYYKIGGTEYDISAPVQARESSARTRKQTYPDICKNEPIYPQDFFDGRVVVPYYAAMFVGLKTSGYATSPTYHKKLTGLFEDLELYKIDWWAYVLKNKLNS